MNKQLGTRHDEKLIARIGLQAELLDMPIGKYVDNALTFYSSLDTKFLKGINGIAENMGITAADLIQRRLSQWMGQIDAHLEVLGNYSDFGIDTLTQGDFESDYLMHKNREVLKIKSELVARGLECEKYGIEPEEYIKELMVKNRKGQAWLESEEYKREVELDKRVKEIQAKELERIKNDPEENAKYEAFKKLSGAKDGEFSTAYWESDKPEE